jgi:hypothetical protein
MITVEQAARWPCWPPAILRPREPWHEPASLNRAKLGIILSVAHQPAFLSVRPPLNVSYPHSSFSVQDSGSAGFVFSDRVPHLTWNQRHAV